MNTQDLGRVAYEAYRSAFPAEVLDSWASLSSARQSVWCTVEQGVLAGQERGQPERIAHGDAVNHPRHYNQSKSGVECITVAEHCTFNIGSALKYLWRFEHKNGVEDLEKSIWYIRREIDRLTAAERQSGGAAVSTPKEVPRVRE